MIVEALKLFIRNIGLAVRITAVPLVLGAAVGLAVAAMMGILPFIDFGTIPPWVDLTDPNLPITRVPFWSIFVLMVLLSLGALIAVQWHRRCLLNAKPQGLLHVGPVGHYIGRTFAIGLCIIPITVGFRWLTGQIGLQGAPGLALDLLVTIFSSYLWLRMAISLPAIATDRRMTFIEGWRIGRSVFSLLLQGAVTLAVLQLAVRLLSVELLQSPQALKLGIEILAYWLLLMISASFMSLIYARATNREIRA